MVRRNGLSTSRSRSGITLTEILISILILGVGLISLATLFPLGLLRLRDAQRSVRSSYLIESAESEIETRNLFSKSSFRNPLSSPWYSPTFTPTAYDPWIQDTSSYGADASAAPLGASANPSITGNFSTGEGLPVAYDPLWRFQTNNGYYPGMAGTFEARFASGIGFVRPDPTAGGFPSAHGLQRITNFNPQLGSYAAITEIFVSPEDVIYQEGNQATTDILGNTLTAPSTTVPVLNPTNNTTTTPLNNTRTFNTVADWRFSWMFTGRQSDVTSGTAFFGDIVVWENRPFAIDTVTTPFTAPSSPWYSVAGEPVVEGVFGYGGTLVPMTGSTTQGYGRASDRVVLLRWPNTSPDPEVRVGGWIADVTYERVLTESNSRFVGGDYPAQRCHWYQVVKKSSVDDESNGAGLKTAGFRAMTVWVATPLKAKTLLNSGTPPQPVHVNAALVSPHVVNVVPRTLYSR